MSYHYFTPIIALILAIINAPVRLYAAAIDFLSGALNLFRPEPLAFTHEQWGGLAHIGGAPLDSALQNALRHEARQHQRGMTRNT